MTDMSDPLLRAEDQDSRISTDLTVEQLAAETGMSVRNIRNHQSRGLLPPPEVRARVGYYGPEHVKRLRLIRDMQAEGFKLSAIKKLIGEHGEDADRVIGLREAVKTPFASESPEVVTLAELVERFGPVEHNAKNLAKAVRLGMLVQIGVDRFEVPSPALLRAAEDVTRRGVPLSAALQVVAKVQRNAHATAKAFVALFLDEIWTPFEQAGQPEDAWPDVTDAIEHLRPLASEALLAIFQRTMEEEVDSTFGKLLERQAKRGR